MRGPPNPCGLSRCMGATDALLLLRYLANGKFVCSTYKKQTAAPAVGSSMVDREGGLEMKASPRRISNLWRCAPGGFAALGGWLSGPVVAAPATDQPEKLEEVVVTAEYREEKLQDTPIAITAFTPQQIEAQGATKLSDILNDAPSVDLRPQSAAFGESVGAYIRGRS